MVGGRRPVTSRQPSGSFASWISISSMVVRLNRSSQGDVAAVLLLDVLADDGLLLRRIGLRGLDDVPDELPQ
jgi:hypothetical protein